MQNNKIRDMDFVVDWSDLPADLWGRIAGCLTTMDDFMAFRGVCTSWRAATAAIKDKFVCKVPLLMLGEKDGSTEREFYSLSKRKICMRISIPAAKGKRCTDVGFGWILALASSGEACLLKPFSSARIELPNFNTFPLREGYYLDPKFYFIHRAMLTANPPETSNFTLLVRLNHDFGFWRNGDKKWMASDPPLSPSTHLVYCNGKMYSLNDDGLVGIWDFQGTDVTKPQRIAKVDNDLTYLCSSWDHYMVASTDGELLLVTRNNTSLEGYKGVGHDHFGVMRVDPVKGEFREMNDLGKDALFLRDNDAVSVDATEFPGALKPNCIYFTDDRIKSYSHNQEWDRNCGKDMVIYNVRDGSIERFNIESFNRQNPSLWIFPSF